MANNPIDDLNKKLSQFATDFSKLGSTSAAYITKYKEYCASAKYDQQLIKEMMKDKINEVYNAEF